MLFVFALGFLFSLFSLSCSHIALPISRPRRYGNSRGLQSVSTPDPIVGCAASDFSVPLSIGGTVFQVIVDTGSSDLALAGSQCGDCTRNSGDSATNIDIEPRYTPGSTAHSLGVTISADYGTGSWSGTVYNDTVSIDNSSSFYLAFGDIRTQSEFFYPSDCNGSEVVNPYQGILGLAYDSLLDRPAESLISKLVSTGIISNNLFTLQLCRTTGTLWLGGYSNDYFIGSLTYTPIVTGYTDQNDYYNVNFIDFKIDGTSIGVSSSAFTKTPVDSGTSLMYLNSAIYDALVNSLRNNNYFKTQFGRNFFEVGNCVQLPTITTAQLNQNLPTITVVLTNASLTLQAVSSYIYELDYYGSILYCPGIVSGGTGKDSNLLGWTFMNQFVTVFDRGNSRLGFAPTYACGAAWAQTGVRCVDQYGTVINNTYCSTSNQTTDSSISPTTPFPIPSSIFPSPTTPNPFLSSSTDDSSSSTDDSSSSSSFTSSPSSSSSTGVGSGSEGSEGSEGSDKSSATEGREKFSFSLLVLGLCFLMLTI